MLESRKNNKARKYVRASEGGGSGGEAGTLHRLFFFNGGG